MYDLLLFLHFVGLALSLGTGFATFTLGIANHNLAPEERKAFMQRLAPLTKNGSIGLLLLLLSGVGLLSMRGVSQTFLAAGGAFHAKLTLVVVLIGLFGYMQVLGKRAREKQDPVAMARMPTVSRYLLATGVTITALAVLAFH